ncbi:MAG: TIGR03936 family radical SAM-associated protein, partial [Bdellovibrionales bacterium]|nr:TIGR03936 family radical SAM-associated protein [Bdellovibrionales bacterium]
FPSTRVDALTPELLQEVQPIRRSGFTMAPEAGTQRLRDVINKGVTDEQIIDTCRNVFTLGWSSVKLYFMIGLPTETDEDVEGIVDIAKRVKALAGRKHQVTVSVSTHVPKPHTPFQWAAQISEGETLRKQRFLFRALKEIGVTFRYHDARSSVLEGIFARGDRSLSRVILRAYTLGTRLDGWMEELQHDRWMQAFEEEGIEPLRYLEEIDTDEPLPWDHISCDIPKRWFKKEWDRAISVRTTPDCLTATCSTCGACDYDANRNILFDRKRTESRLQIVNPPWERIIQQRQRGESVELLGWQHQKPDLERLVESQPTPEENGTYALKDYLKTEINSRKETLFRPAQKVQSLLRVRYAKSGSLSFVGHLELMRGLFRATRRAALPVVFTKGFHPKPKFAFGPPLQLGIQSAFEFVDIPLYELIGPLVLLEALNREAPPGFQALEAHEISSSAPSVQSITESSTYHATLSQEIRETSEALMFEDWSSKEVERRHKGKKRCIPLRDFVERAELLSPRSFSFTLRVNEKGATLKPLEVIEAMSPYHAFLFDVKKTGVQFSQSPFALEQKRSLTHAGLMLSSVELP